MADANTIVRDRQLVVRRQLDARQISLKAVSFDSGIPYPTIVSYFPGEKDKVPATIGGAALFMLCAGADGKGPALPLDLLSLILPDGFQIVRAPEELNHDEYETMCRDYLAAKGRAHQVASPGGREIADCERADLDGKIVQLRAA
jgi:hypothetical protein